MRRLVCKSGGDHFYKRSSHLVRTPISKKFTLYPVDQYNYDVGDEYRLSLPTRDFRKTSGGTFSIVSGHAMRKCYLGRDTPSHDSSGWSQLFRHNLSFPNYDTGFVYYGGNYSPAYGLTAGASFLRVPAYSFNLPTSITSDADSGWYVSDIKTTFVNHGIVITSGSAGTKKTQTGRYPVFAQYANTNLLQADSDWRDGYSLSLGVFNIGALLNYHARDLESSCQDTVFIPAADTDACDNLGSANGYPLWETWPDGSVTYNDGKIIHAPNNPNIVTATGNVALCDAVTDSMSDGYIILALIPPVSDSGGNGNTETALDYPSYHFTNSSGGAMDWWLCTRILIKSIEITFSLD